MIKIFVLIMVIGDGIRIRPAVVTQEFHSLRTCQQALKSVTTKVRTVYSSGCYEK